MRRGVKRRNLKRCFLRQVVWLGKTDEIKRPGLICRINPSPLGILSSSSFVFQLFQNMCHAKQGSRQTQQQENEGVSKSSHSTSVEGRRGKRAKNLIFAPRFTFPYSLPLHIPHISKHIEWTHMQLLIQSQRSSTAFPSFSSTRLLYYSTSSRLVLMNSFKLSFPLNPLPILFPTCFLAPIAPTPPVAEAVVQCSSIISIELCCFIRPCFSYSF